MTENSFLPSNFGSSFLKQAWYTSIAYLTYCLFGIMRGYPSSLLLQLQSPESNILVKTPDEVSWIASLSIFPNPFGSILAGILMDKIGRKPTLQLSMLVFTIGWAFITVSNNLVLLYLGNIVVGIAIGMGACSTIYVTEICEMENRCMLLSFLEIYFSLGILIASGCTSYFKWNVAAAIFAIFSAFSLALLCSIPESPYWLLKKRRTKDAFKSLEKLRARGAPGDDRNEMDYQDVVKAVESDIYNEPGPGNWNALLEFWKPLYILVLFHVLLQGSGYTILLSYFSDFVSDFKLPYGIHGVTMGYTFTSFVASFLTPLSVHFWKRRTVTIFSGFGMALSFVAIETYIYYDDRCVADDVTNTLTWVVPAGLYTFVLSCTIGILTLSQAMIGELYPTEVRGIMCGITEALGTVLSAICVKIYPIIKIYLDKRVILAFFAVFSLMTVLYGKFILPETYGKTLDQIQKQYFPKKKPSLT